MMEIINKRLIVAGLLAALPLFSGILHAAPTPAPDGVVEVKQVKHAATLEEIEGNVLVYRGDKYLPAKNEMKVEDGNRLMVMKKSQVKLVYENGCSEIVDSFRIFNVDMARCKLIWWRQFPHNALALGALHVVVKNTEGKRKKRKPSVSP